MYNHETAKRNEINNAILYGRLSSLFDFNTINAYDIYHYLIKSYIHYTCMYSLWYGMIFSLFDL